MKNILFFYCLLFLQVAKSDGQIINGNFENWNGNEPNNWVSTNALMILGNPQSVFKSTDVHEGSFACEINTIAVKNKVPGFPIPDYTGSIFTGKQVGFNTIMGVPFSYKPTMLRFWYTYNARNGDSASIIAYTTKWNSTNNRRDTLSIGFGIIKDSVGVYTKMELNLSILDTSISPDTAVVLFASSTVTAKAEGARLVLDEVALVGGNVGLIKERKGIDFSVYPNPAKNGLFKIELRQHTQELAVDIFDFQGKCMAAYQVKDSRFLEIPTDGFPVGIYQIRVRSNESISYKKLMIE